uniref:Janus kinase and microtubule-interacting protein C-terminal domain-containing protein n=2 Tax=Clastoptera arizonana TaxID=38151 RepID=A0A1B6D1K9_9HEMI
MANKLRTQEVAALRRALDSERYTTKLVQEKNGDLKKALEGERKALRALRREVAEQVKAAREEECAKYTAMLEQLRTKMALSQSEAVEMQKENTRRALAVEFQKEMHAREEELKKEAKRQIVFLQEQLKEAVKSQQQELPPSEKDTLMHTLHTEYQKTLHAKQEEWKRETKLQVEAVTAQWKETQRQCQELMAKVAAAMVEADQAHKLRQEVQTLKSHNKELEEKVQILTESERKKVEDFRSQHDEFDFKINEIQKAARKEANQLLEEIKSKNRRIAEIEREMNLVLTQLSVQKELNTSWQLSSNSSSRMRLDAERPGEPPRLCPKRIKPPSFVSEMAKRVSGGEAHPKPSDRNFSSKAEISHDNVTTDLETKDKTTETNTFNTSNIRPPKCYTSESMTNDDILNNSWTKVVGLDALYKLLYEEHQDLQRNHQSICTKLREEEKTRIRLEEQLRDYKQIQSENGINLAMADQIQALQERQMELESEAQELREQNDLLEFRILELDTGMCSSSGSFHAKLPSSPEMDDISDSGVMSLTTSEDISESDFQDFKLEPNNRDVKYRLAQLWQSMENVNDQMCLQQSLALLRYYESRIEGLEATLAAMCQEATMSRSNSILSDTSGPLNTDTTKSPSRIVATVLPFTDPATNYEKDVNDESPIKKLFKDADSLQESGIFEGSAEATTQGTQTDCLDKSSNSPGDLGAEIRKLTQIRERIEEQGGNKKLLKVPVNNDIEINIQATLKELLYYRERIKILEDKISAYESSGDDQIKHLATRLERESLLTAQIESLKNTLNRLTVENKQLEEEKCEFEEAENDTRLRCQKLEVKLSALGEKKSDLQVQLQQNARTIFNLRSSLAEEERKKVEAKQGLARVEIVVSQLEQQNFELEEKEMELRCKLQVLEVTLPALMIWFLWKILNSDQPHTCYSNIVSKNILTLRDPTIQKESEEEESRIMLKNKLKELEEKLEVDSLQLTESRDKERALKHRLEELERLVKFKDKTSTSVLSHHKPTDRETELESKCKTLEEKIKEYVMMEEKYKTTIREVDEFWTREKLEMRERIEDLEEKLVSKDKELDRVGGQMKRHSMGQVVELQLQENIEQLHQEMSDLREQLLHKEKENKRKEDAEKELWQQLNEAVEQIDYFKKDTEVSLKEEINKLKVKNKHLSEQLELSNESDKAERDSQMSTIKHLRKSLKEAEKELEENDVNISELREEVGTLESALIEIREILQKERHEKEIYILKASAEIADKDNEIKRLSSELSHIQAESLADSMIGDLQQRPLGSQEVDEDDGLNGIQNLQTEVQVDPASTSDVPASRKGLKTPHLPSDCSRSQFLAEVETIADDVPIFINRVQAALEDSLGCQTCKNKGTTDKLKHILNLIYETDSKTRLVNCLNSRLATARVEYHDASKTTQIVKSALKHSINCQNCSDNLVLGELQDILNRLQRRDHSFLQA